MTDKEKKLEDIFNSFKNRLSPWINNSHFGVEYSIKGIGFGEFSFKIADGKLMDVKSECMSKDFVKAVLCKLIDEAEWDDKERE